MKFAFLAIYLLCLTATQLLSASAEVIRPGKVTFRGSDSNVAGSPLEFIATATVTKNIVTLESILSNGGIVQDCAQAGMKFSGKLDLADFEKGNVIAISRDSETNTACTLLPNPVPDQLFETDQIIFREILVTSTSGDDILVTTSFVSGADVVPEMSVDIPIGSGERRALKKGLKSEVALAENLLDFSKSGTVNLADGLTMEYELRLRGGFNKFSFNRKQVYVTWEQFIQADASSTFTLAKSLSTSDSVNLFSVAIPGAGFSLHVPLAGRITAGIVVRGDAQFEMSSAGSVVVSARASYRTGQNVTLGLRRRDASRLPVTEDGDANFQPQASAAGSVKFEGFSGVRLAVAAALKVPLLGEASADLGATAGVQVNAGFESVPYSPLTGGQPLTDVCQRRHYVRAWIELQGRELGSILQLGKKKKYLLPIGDPFFKRNIGTICLFQE